MKFGRLLTRRREGQLLLRASRRTAQRIQRWRAELEAKGPISPEDQRELDDWERWNIARESEGYRLLRPPPLVLRLRKRHDGWYEPIG